MKRSKICIRDMKTVDQFAKELIPPGYYNWYVAYGEGGRTDVVDWYLGWAMRPVCNCPDCNGQEITRKSI